ncbi:MAG: hypothetical protein JWN21_2034 [Sphingomonas bacterium]|uniref:DUF2827 family protein n=1 Tax=Sphingomonas bacterium TaxID=1895847 RepID=UPI002623A399|nr:DUF2827 family protein [Sphingomonas bacterium]MDB5696491.1 hypothetical protein [Sphingomonas bacterium]
MARVKRPKRKGYTVGITIFVRPGGDLGLYENGLRQNVLFLWQLFTAAPNCARVHLLNHGDGEFTEWPPGIGMEGVPVFRTAEVADELDYLIVIGAAVDNAALDALRARGCRVIGYKGGNAAVISMEAMIARPVRTDAERYGDVGRYDALWMTPQHIHTYAGWARTVYRVPVHEVPQVWAPTFIDNRAAHLEGRFGYKPGRERWRVGIMEPNITIMKTSHVAMLACESAYRKRPEAFESVLVSNTFQHREQPHFRSFASALDVVKAGVMTFEQRFVSADFLTNHCDAVVTHHWENGLNYLYYEVLHGGYPLVHNSAWLKDWGYYYPDFGAEAGGDALLAAFATHDERLDEYRSNVAELVARLAPSHPDNIKLHEQLLVDS